MYMLACLLLVRAYESPSLIVENICYKQICSVIIPSSVSGHFNDGSTGSTSLVTLLTLSELFPNRDMDICTPEIFLEQDKMDKYTQKSF